MTFVEWFEQSGYRQAELAKLVGTTSTAVCYWANGQKQPRRETREKIEKIAGVKIDWIQTNPDNFAEVFGEIRKAYHLVDQDEKGAFLFYVENYLNGENVKVDNRRSAYLGLMAVKPYLEPYRNKAYRKKETN